MHNLLCVIFIWEKHMQIFWWNGQKLKKEKYPAGFNWNLRPSKLLREDSAKLIFPAKILLPKKLIIRKI